MKLLCKIGIHDRSNLQWMYDMYARRVPAWEKSGYLCARCLRWKRNLLLWQWTPKDWVFFREYRWPLLKKRISSLLKP